MKNTLKYTAAALLVFASLNTYAKTNFITSGTVKLDANSVQQGEDAEWSGLNLDANSAEINLKIEAEAFSVTLTLDGAEWAENRLLRDGKAIPSSDLTKQVGSKTIVVTKGRRKNTDLARLLDAAYITFKTSRGEVSLGKQSIELMPKMETSSLESNKGGHYQVMAIRFTNKGKEALAGIGIDASFYELGSYDNKFADEYGFNIILSKDIDKNLMVSLGLRSNESLVAGEDDRENTFTARGVYQMSPKASVSAQFQKVKDDVSNFQIAGEYQVLPNVIAGASFKNSDNDIDAKSYTETKLYAVKQMNSNTQGEIYWSKKIVNENDDDAESKIGARVLTKF